MSEREKDIYSLIDVNKVWSSRLGAKLQDSDWQILLLNPTVPIS